MIKRRFYRFTHGDKDAPSDSDSSSDSDVEVESTDESEDEDEQEDNAVGGVREDDGNSSSGYESEDSSANEVNLDSSGLPSSDDDLAAQNGSGNIGGSRHRSRGNLVLPEYPNSPVEDKIEFDATDCILKVKSVYKCRLCPRIVCLSEDTLKTHLNSKRHARSEKLLKEGRLKLMLNEMGEIEGETSSPEKQTTTTDDGQELAKSKKKGKGRREEKKRSRQEAKKTGGSAKNRAKRRSK